MAFIFNFSTSTFLAAGLGNTLLMTFQVVLVVVVSFVLLLYGSSFIRYQLMMHAIDEVAPEEIEPEDRFRKNALERMGSVHRTPDPFMVMMMKVRNLDALDPAEAAFEHMDAVLKGHTRKSDYVDLLEHHVVGLILNAKEQDAAGIGRRLTDAVRQDPCPSESSPPVTLDINGGLVTYPKDGFEIGTLMDQAEKALAQAETERLTVCYPSGSDASDKPEEEPYDFESLSRAQKNMVDELTGVLRTDRINYTLQKYLSQYRKLGQAVSVMVVDIDYLDQYNQHYGNAGGDSVLRGLGTWLEKNTRLCDLIGRLGGDEFLVCMPIPPEAAVKVAQRLLADIGKARFKHEEAELRITACLGVAGHPDHGHLPEQLILAAKTALKVAKREGKGKCLKFDQKIMKAESDDHSIDTF